MKYNYNNININTNIKPKKYQKKNKNKNKKKPYKKKINMNFINRTFSIFDPINKLINPFILYTILIVIFNPILTPKIIKKKKSIISTSKKKFNKIISQNIEKKKVLIFQKFIIKTFTVILIFNLISLYPFS